MNTIKNTLFRACLAISLLWHCTLAADSFYQASRYNSQGLKTGDISADPDGDGPLGYPAVRYSYNSRGLLTREEVGELSSFPQTEVSPDDWEGFTVHVRTDIRYDDYGRPIQNIRYGDGQAVARTDTSYDELGRQQCVATRMGDNLTSNLTLSPCVLMHAETTDLDSNQTLDRITRYTYNNRDKIVTITKGVGTSLEQVYAEYDYIGNYYLLAVTDARGNRAEMDYDGHFRLYRWYFPDKDNGQNIDSEDYEEYWYDDNDNQTHLIRRDGNVITSRFDNLNQLVQKSYSVATMDSVHYQYDLRGLQKRARYKSLSGLGTSYQYDGFGRLTHSSNSTTGPTYRLSYAYDARGNRTRITHADNKAFYYDFDNLDRLTDIREQSATAPSVISHDYNHKSLPHILSRGTDGAESERLYDTALRVSDFSHDFTDAAHDLTLSFTYNPANQVTSRSYSNPDYLYTQNRQLLGEYQVNDQNQYDCIGSSSGDCAGGEIPVYDDNGNLEQFAGDSFDYDAENRLIEHTRNGVTTTFHYDPMGRLVRAQQSGNTLDYVYDGNALIAKYENGSLSERYLHGDRIDNPLVGYTGNSVTTSSRYYLHQDHQGSIVAHSNSEGHRTKHISYDEYGIPETNGMGLFAYTGQIVLPFTDSGDSEDILYHYKARVYHPKLGRFLQTDPVGYEDQMNLYAYVHNDPMTYNDPTGKVANIIVKVVQCATKKACRDTVTKKAKEIWTGKDKIKRDPKITNERWKRNSEENGGKNRCENCGDEVERGGQSKSGVPPQENRGVVDHIDELQDVGQSGDNIDNTQILCDPCHDDKTNREREKRKKRGKFM